MLLSLLLVACAPGSLFVADTDVGEVTSTTGDTTDTGNAPTSDPIAITDHDVTCDDGYSGDTGTENVAHLRVSIAGPAASGHWYTAFTGAWPSTVLAENHPLAPVEGELGVDLEIWGGASYERGEKTMFGCASSYHAPDYTFIVRAYRADGTLGDCLAWGQDPVGLLAGEYPPDYPDNPQDYAMPPEHPEELVGCRVEEPAR